MKAERIFVAARSAKSTKPLLAKETLRRMSDVTLEQVQGGTDTIVYIQKPGH